MYHSVTTNIPVASTETLRRRRLLLDSNGIHLTYNVPRKSPKTSRLAPVKPFAGMTISFLIYVQDNAEKWCLQVGSGDERSNKRFRIGYTGHGDQYGRYFIGEKNNQWNGPNTKDHPGYPGRQYLHVHIHFSGPDKAEGYINDEKLGEAQSSSLNQFPDLVHFGSEKEPPPTICSIHWTTWAPGKPAASQAIKEKLFQAGTFVPLDATIFEARVGTEMTVECKYIKNFAEKDGVRIGVAPIGTTGLYNMVTISGYRNPNRTYIVRVSIMEGSYILAFAERAFRVEHYTRAEAPEGYFFDLTSNMKPIRVFVDTMGQTW